MRVLVVGGSGFLGGALVSQALASGHAVTATYASHPHSVPAAPERGAGRAASGSGQSVAWVRLDVRERARVAEAVAGSDLVVNAAYRQDDWRITADGAAHVALAAAAAGARLVHVSTDAVFSGRAPSYAVTAPPDPVTPYGAAKAAAETAVLAIAPDAVVARTSLILGTGSPFERLVHGLATGRIPGALFTDDVRRAVHVADLAKALLDLERPGVHHLVGADALTRHELGVLVAARDGLDPAALPGATRAELGIPGPLELHLEPSTPLRGAREFLC